MLAVLPLVVASFLAALTSASPVESLESRQVPSDDRLHVIINKCPAPIKLYIAGAYWTTVPQGGSVAQATGGAAGPYYTDANGGEAGGLRATKAVFWDRNIYYIVKDPNHLNTAITIEPKRFGRQGLCVPISCRTSVCDQGFPLPGPSTLPPPGTVHPTPPFYACGAPDGEVLQYDITFCPDGKWPTYTQGADIHPGYNPGKCLDVRGAVFANGTPVQVYDCNGTKAQRWVFQRGSTKVRVANTNFCLDAGSNPANGINLKIWQCYDNLRAQQWNYEQWTDKIKLNTPVNGKTYCADLRNGILTNSNPFQTWECFDNNQNQVFTIPFA